MELGQRSHSSRGLVKDTYLCSQNYGIGAVYISALAVMGGSRNPLNDLRALETEMKKVSMPADSGKEPYKPCDETRLALLRNHALEMMARILVAAGRGQEALPVLAELKNTSFRLADAAELYATLGDRKLALAVAQQTQGKDRTEILVRVGVALADQGDVTGAQEILSQLEEPARLPVQVRISALRGNWAEAWKLTQGVSGSDQFEILRSLSAHLSKKGTGPEAVQVARSILATQGASPEFELVGFLARNGQLDEALFFAGPSIKTDGYRLNGMLAVVPELLKAGRKDEAAKLATQAKGLGSRYTYVRAAQVLKFAGLSQEADAVLQQAVADSEQGEEAFSKFLNKTQLAGDLRSSGFLALIPDLLKNAKDLVEDPGRCNRLTGLSYQYAAIGRYGEAAASVQQCIDKGNQAWRVLAHALTLLEYARETNPTFRERFQSYEVASSLKGNFQLADIYGLY